jgi:hypothetical protein
MGSRLGRTAVAVLAITLAACAPFENEGRSGEAEATLSRYLANLAGSSDDRGWSQLTPPMRDAHGPREEYVARVQLAGDAQLSVESMLLVREDDGLYEFAVTVSEPTDPFSVLFHEPPNWSAIACPIDHRRLQMFVIIAPIGGSGGVTGPWCEDA